MTRDGFRRIGCHGLGLIVLLTLAGARPLQAVGTNDHFANASSLFGITNFTISNVGSTTEPGEPRHAGEPVESTLWWKWTVPFTASFSVVTTNSRVTANVQLDIVAAVYTGNALSNLTLIVANDDTMNGEFGATWSRCVFRAYAGETLMIAVGSLGATGTIRFSVDVAGPFMDPWQAPGLYGDTLFSTNFSGQVLLIDFWETICGACIEELPSLIRVQSFLSPRGFTLIGLSGDADVADVLDYMPNSGINYPVAMGDSALQYQLAGRGIGYPTKLLVDREGRLVEFFVGANTETGYRSIIEPVLRSSSLLDAGITRAGPNVTIRWPSSAMGYTVESTMQFTGGTWSNVGIAPMVTNGEYRVTVPASASAQFFRLKKL